jgi:guanylate kinase
MLFVVCGPSGAGKTTLVQRLMSRRPRLQFSISHTTRAARGQEQHGADYFFVSDDEFAAILKNDGFAEHASVHAYRYGTARSTLSNIDADGRDAVLDIDYQGARQISSSYPDAVTVLIAPPSMESLESRLRTRATDSEEQVKIRLDKARHELSHYRLFKYVVVNDVIDDAVARLDAIYLAEQARVPRNERFLTALLDENT